MWARAPGLVKGAGGGKVAKGGSRIPKIIPEELGRKFAG